MTVEEIREFVQIRTPDKAALANYINRAKGSDRTMAQFAEECEVSAPTLSRIVNEKITKPLSTDLIIKIFEKRAEKEDEYLLEALARANGLCPKVYAEKASMQDSFVHRRNIEMSRLNQIKNALIAEAVSKELYVERILSGWRTRPSENAPAIYPRQHIDFTLLLNKEKNANNIDAWSFFIYPYKPDEGQASFDARDKKHLMDNIFDNISRWFLMDVWYPESLSRTKTSFVFAEEELFIEFVMALKEANLNNEMTVILMDTNKYVVTKEIWLPGNYKKLTETSIFDSESIDYENNSSNFEEPEEL